MSGEVAQPTGGCEEGSAPHWERNLILRVLCGSRAYGLETPESDTDTRGVSIPPKRFLLGLERFDQHVSEDGDHVVFSLEKFVRLALSGNPTVIETLFVEEQDVLASTRLGRRLFEERELFLSRRVAERFGGYAHGQLGRIKRHRRWVADPPQREPAARDFGAREEAGKTVWPSAQAQKSYKSAHKQWGQYESWKAGRNPKRAALEAKHGYDTKHAMHLCRLLLMGEELLSDGVLLVRRRDDEAWLRGVRAGQLSYDELLAWADEHNAQLTALRASSPLPEEPDHAAAEALVVELQEAFHWGHDSRSARPAT